MADVLHCLQIHLGNIKEERAFPSVRKIFPHFGNSIRIEKMLHYLFCYCWGETNSLRDTRTGNNNNNNSLFNSKQGISYIVSSFLFTQLHAATYITKCLGWLTKFFISLQFTVRILSINGQNVPQK